MSEKTKATSKASALGSTRPAPKVQQPTFSQSQPALSPLDQIMFLQRTVGNRAIQGLLKSDMIQSKLRISQPGDKYEQEAGCVVEQVMKMPEPQCPECENEQLIQQKPLASTAHPDVQKQVDEEEKEQEGIETVQTKLFSKSELPLIQRQTEEREEEEGKLQKKFFYCPLFISKLNTDPHGPASNIQRTHGEDSPNLGVNEIPTVGERVDRVGIINRDRLPEVRMRSSPDTTTDNIIRTLPFNTHVQVIRRLPGGWSFVATPSGEMGYVASVYIWTNLPEPNVRLHRVQSGIAGTAIAIAERYYREQADDWGQDLRFYVNVLAFVNNIQVPSSVSGWRQVHFDANDLIWIPSHEFARGLRGTISSGSRSYEFAQSLGIASVIERAGELWDDFRRAISLSRRYLTAAIARHSVEALRNALLSLAIMLVAAVAILAISTAVGAAIGALAGGAGAAPGAAAGFEVGMVILEWLGLAMLIVWIGTVLYQVGAAFAQFISTVWSARGDERRLDRAGREFAEAIGTLIGAIIEAVVLLAASYGIGRGLGLVRNTRFGQSMSESRFGEWVGERVRNFGEGRTPIRRPADVLLRFYRNVEIVDTSGAPLGEFDAINMNRRMFIEDKSAQGLNVLNPRTGRPQQAPAQWAQRQIVRKTVTRIRNLSRATATRPAGGSPTVPTLAEIQGFRRLHFRIDGNTPALRAAVMAELANLRAQFPGWQFTVEFGANIFIPPIPISESEGER